MERFAPHDTVFAIASAAQLTDTGLAGAGSSHTVTASVSSSSSSLQQRRLADIAESADEHSDEAAGARNEAPPAGDALELAVVVTTPDGPSAAGRDRDAPGRAGAGDWAQALAPRRPSVNSVSSANSLGPDLDYSYFPYTPKPKLGPRPHVDHSSRRPHTADRDRPSHSASADDLRAALPKSVHLPRKPAVSQARTKSLTSASLRSLPDLPRPASPLSPSPSLSSLLSPRTPAAPASTPADAPPGLTPEKQRLMRALQLRRQKNFPTESKEQDRTDATSVDIAPPLKTPTESIRGKHIGADEHEESYDAAADYHDDMALQDDGDLVLQEPVRVTIPQQLADRPQLVINEVKEDEKKALKMEPRETERKEKEPEVEAKEQESSIAEDEVESVKVRDDVDAESDAGSTAVELPVAETASAVVPPAVVPEAQPAVQPAVVPEAQPVVVVPEVPRLASAVTQTPAPAPVPQSPAAASPRSESVSPRAPIIDIQNSPPPNVMPDRSKSPAPAQAPLKIPKREHVPAPVDDTPPAENSRSVSAPFLKSARQATSPQPAAAKKVNAGGGGSVLQRIKQFQMLSANLEGAAAAAPAPSLSRSNSPTPSSVRGHSRNSSIGKPTVPHRSLSDSPVPRTQSQALNAAPRATFRPVSALGVRSPSPTKTDSKVEIVEKDNKPQLQVTTVINRGGTPSASPTVASPTNLDAPLLATNRRSLDLSARRTSVELSPPNENVSPRRSLDLSRPSSGRGSPEKDSSSRTKFFSRTNSNNAKSELGELREDAISPPPRRGSSSSRNSEKSQSKPGILRRISTSLSRKEPSPPPQAPPAVVAVKPPPPPPEAGEVKTYRIAGWVNVQLPDTMVIPVSVILEILYAPRGGWLTCVTTVVAPPLHEA